MDKIWFKHRQRQTGITSSDLGNAMKRDRTVVSKILNGHQRMSLDQAQIFAELLKAPLSEILLRAGITDAATSKEVNHGFSEGDAHIWEGKQTAKQPERQIAKALGADRPGVDTWRVKTDALALAGIMPRDFILVDTHASHTCQAGDNVLAQVYDHSTGSAVTLLRRYIPPVLVTASSNMEHTNGLVVDDNTIVIVGRVITSWRLYTNTPEIEN